MTGTEKIKTKIIEDANAKALEIEKQARDDAQAIMEQASADIAKKRATLLQKAEDQT